MKPIYISLSLLLSIVLFFSCEDGGSSPSQGGESGKGGSMARFTISNNHLYTVDKTQLKVFDISIADQPQYMESKDVELGWGVETIFAMDTLLFIGSQDGMHILNITRPDFPQVLSFVQHIQSCDPVVATKTHAYVTLNSENVWCGRTSNVLLIFDISNPAKPELKHTEMGLVSPKGLAVDGNKLFICDNGLKVFDISDPIKPKWIGDLSQVPEMGNVNTYDVIPIDGTLLLTGSDGFFQLDYLGDKLSFMSEIKVTKK